MRIVRQLAGSSFLAILLMLLTAAVFAQNSSQATLRGVITDPSGARIPQATIQLRGPAGDQTQTTDANGQYTFTQLPPAVTTSK